MTTDVLRLACLDAEAPPLFHRSPDGVTRRGFEPGAAELVAAVIGRRVEWLMVPWADMIPAVRRGDADAVWCGQGVTVERLAQVDYTRPYAIFHESVLVRRGAAIAEPAALAGRRVAAISGSTNETLARTFTGAIVEPFGGDSGDVFGDMLAALRGGDVDAVVDDDVAFLSLGDDPAYEIAFTVATGNRWGVGIAKDRPELLGEINAALAAVIADGQLRAVWEAWMPTLPFPALDRVE